MSFLSISFSSDNMLKTSESSGMPASREVPEVRQHMSLELSSPKLDLMAKCAVLFSMNSLGAISGFNTLNQSLAVEL